MLQDMLPAVLLGSEDSLLDTLGATVVCGNGSFTALDLIHRLVTGGLLMSSHTELTLRLQERVSVIQRLPAAAPAFNPLAVAGGSARTEAGGVPLGGVEARQTGKLPIKAEGSDQNGSFRSVIPGVAPAPPGQAHLVCGAQAQQHAQQQVASGERDSHMFECLFPGCGRKYASSDATRKHARKQHRGWLESLPALQHAQNAPH